MLRKGSVVGVFLAVSACAGAPQIAMAPGIVQAPEHIMPAPTGVRNDGTFIYVLGALDKISIEVDGMPDMVREVVVDGDGMVSYPLAGPVRAAGLTTTE